MKILIAEDEILTARNLKFEIEDLGVDVMDPVVKGEEAVSLALSEHPDLILMDIRLAGDIGGIEAAERIQRKQNIPIVFMTGYAKEDFLDKINKIKPLGFLEKPVNIYLIRNIIRGLAEPPR